MSDALLADGTEPTTDATTTPGEGASTDTPSKPAEQQQVGEPTTDATTTVTEPKAEPKPEEPIKRAPENYEFRVPSGLPEGFELDGAVTGEIANVARELDLSQDQAQSLIDKVWPVMHRRAEEQQASLNDEWKAETRADKEIGGQKLDENLAIAKKAIRAYGSDGLRELLNSPIGSHPEVVRFLVKVGQTVSEDSFVGGNGPGKSVDLNDDAAMAQVLYPNSTG